MKIITILTALVVGFLVLGGFEVATVTSGPTLLSQKQLETSESENLEKLQFPVIVIHVREIYGTLDNPQYRPLANVKVKITIIPNWRAYWRGTTDENGTTEEIKVEIGFLYDVFVSKYGYHVYGYPHHKSVGIDEGIKIYDVYFIMAENGSPFVKQISKSKQQIQLKQLQLEDVESEFQSMDLNSLLSLYGIDTEDTIGEFEQLLYNLVSKEKRGNPSLAAELMNDIDELVDVLKQIGVTDDMTIAKAIPIIENNKEKLQAEGKNLFCSIDIYLCIGSCWPVWRPFMVIYGIWSVDEIWDDTSYVTIKGLTGLQSCEGRKCTENYEGRFICLIGYMIYNFQVCTPYIKIRGFVYFSESNVPFVNSTSNSHQSQCPCNQQSSNQLNNQQNNSQSSQQSSNQLFFKIIQRLLNTR